MSVLTHFIGWARYMTGPTHTQYWVGPAPPRIDATADYSVKGADFGKILGLNSPLPSPF